jgi:hypothetical protein
MQVKKKKKKKKIVEILVYKYSLLIKKYKQEPKEKYWKK